MYALFSYVSPIEDRTFNIKAAITKSGKSVVVFGFPLRMPHGIKYNTIVINRETLQAALASAKKLHKADRHDPYLCSSKKVCVRTPSIIQPIDPKIIAFFGYYIDEINMTFSKDNRLISIIVTQHYRGEHGILFMATELEQPTTDDRCLSEEEREPAKQSTSLTLG
jgi:hypothetical protein